MTQLQHVSSLPLPLDHERLSGWKEIASYVGKSVRSVQRWERELDLPVHRIHTARGEIIYAFRSEIDHWQMAAGNLQIQHSKRLRSEKS